MQEHHSTESPVLVVGRYLLLRRIDDGEHAETWEAHDTRLERTVVLRLVAAGERDDPVARAHLRQATRAAALGTDPGAPRILDGGVDATYGPFVVAELNAAFEATRPLGVIAPNGLAQSGLPVPPPATDRPTPPEPQRRRTGLVALFAVALLAITTLVFLGRALVPSDQSPASPRPTSSAVQPTRPLVGAPSNQPTTVPTVVPTLAPPGASTQAARPPATAPVEAPAASPVDTIRQHYALITARRYAEGYQLMDAHLRNLNTPADYASWFANKVSVAPVSIALVSQNDQQAVVRSVVQSTDRVNGQDVTTEVSEQFVLHYEDHAWRIDQVSPI